MAKIVINKNFQKRYLFKAYERLLKNDYNVNYMYVSPVSTWIGNSIYYPISNNDGKIYYRDLYSNEIDVKGKISNIFVCTESVLKIFDKINSSLKDLNSLTLYSGGVIDVLKLTNSLYSSSKTARDGVFYYLKIKNIITEEEYNLKDSFFCVDINSSTSDSTDKEISLEDNILSLSINKPLKLLETYKSINNIDGESLYLLMFPFNDTKFVNNIQNKSFFNNYSETANSIYPSGFTRMYIKDTNETVFQIPYVAFSLSEENGGGDIEYDHLDEIEYLDNIKLSIELPKQYS